MPAEVADRPLLAAFSTSVLALWLLSECWGKRAIFRPAYQHLAPEETAGILDRIFFWWMNPLLRQGYKTLLNEDDLPKIDHKLSPKTTRENVLRAWDQRSIFFPPSLLPKSWTQN